MKLKELESNLQLVEPFKQPKLHLEQFITTPHLASQILFNIDQSYDDLNNKLVCDLGCGTGMLSIGSSLLDADYVLGIDIDSDVLEECQANISQFEINNIDLINCDCERLLNNKSLNGKFDTVVTNPPFGTKNQGIDVTFLRVASMISSHSIYSLHKKTTRNFLKTKSAQLGLDMEVVTELRYNIPKVDNRNKNLYKTAPEKDIFVDFIRFTKANN